ncbi:hypothetical protein [Streptomyces sp. NBC_00154]|nr:hypothetical protein [Streptomyces sp. NBC_00154]MCX5315594.1 hypothetical protein [Streptomyces sp. NBC_00154]
MRSLPEATNQSTMAPRTRHFTTDKLGNYVTNRPGKYVIVDTSALSS